MARPKGSFKIPSYRHHKGSGQAVVTISGRERYLGKYGSDESRNKYGKLIAEMNIAGPVVAHRPGEIVTIAELVAGYWRHVTNYHSIAEQGVTRNAMRHLVKLYGDTSAEEFGPLAFKALRDHLIGLEATCWNRRLKTYVGIGRKLSRKTINTIGQRVKYLIKWGVENELIKPSVWHAIRDIDVLRPGRSAARETPKVKPVDTRFVDPIVDRVAAPVAAMIKLQLLTGMRSGEMVLMRGCDINTSQGVWEYRPTHHKTKYLGIERVIYLGPQAQEIIGEFLRPDLQAFIFQPADALVSSQEKRDERGTCKMNPALRAQKRASDLRRRRRRGLRSRTAPRYTTHTYYNTIRKACIKEDAARRAAGDERGFPLWHPHQLRHNCATLIRKQFDRETAQVICGHANGETTEIYTEEQKERAIAAIAKVG